jgi:hypothetical protein
MDIAKHLVDAIMPPILASVAKTVKKSSESIRVSISKSISEYLDRSYDRCATVRTIVSHDRSVLLEDIYVQNTVKSGARGISEDMLIDTLMSGQKIVVSAIAGQGKTFLSKYIALKLMKQPTGKIPLLINLRDVEYHPGEGPKYDPLGFVRQLYKICGSISDIQYDNEEIFLSSLSEGVFILVLDGFDEVSIAQKRVIGAELRALANRLPKAGCLVTSRFGTGADLMEGYLSFQLSALSKDQALSLILKSPYDDVAVKSHFADEVDQVLFETHKSFVQVPLLCLVMLLSYKRYGPISDRLTTFYALAYSALFLEADATKAGYRRDRLVPLSIEEFGRVFSALCAKTFLDARFSFNRLEILEEIRKALLYYDFTTVSPSDFLDDLIESVCLLYKDGLEFNFVHRSFQEYFCALFLCNYEGVNVEKVIGRALLPSRNAGVGFMMREINPVALEQRWVVQMLARLTGLLKSVSEANSDKLLTLLGTYRIVAADRGHAIRFEKKREHWFWEAVDSLTPIYREFSPFGAGVANAAIVSMPLAGDHPDDDARRSAGAKLLADRLRRQITNLNAAVRERAHRRAELDPDFF